jgi:hypothetical protein
MNATLTTIKTVKVEYTEAQTIRIVAKVDMPEYGLTEGQCFYAVRSSKNDGTYYLVTWNFDRMKWDCRCPSYKPCRHEKAVNLDCHKEHSIYSYKPVAVATVAPCKAEVKVDAVAQAEAFIAMVQAKKEQEANAQRAMMHSLYNVDYLG